LNDLLSLNINHDRKDVEVDMDVVQSIIMDMKNGKMAGDCGVSADMIKSFISKHMPKK
jgi:hypothetical protein